MLPDYLLAELIPRTPCPGCGVADRVVHFQFPQIRINEAHDQLYLVGYCAGCRAYSPLHIRIPRLLLGFILLQVFEQRARLRLDAKRYVIVEAQTGDALAQFTSDYRDLLSRTATEDSLELLKTERDAFEMDERSWRKFMARLGLDNDMEDSQ
jgi:hypothetical protein